MVPVHLPMSWVYEYINCEHRRCFECNFLQGIWKFKATHHRPYQKKILYQMRHFQLIWELKTLLKSLDVPFIANYNASTSMITVNAIHSMFLKPFALEALSYQTSFSTRTKLEIGLFSQKSLCNTYSNCDCLSRINDEMNQTWTNAHTVFSQCYGFPMTNFKAFYCTVSASIVRTILLVRSISLWLIKDLWALWFLYAKCKNDLMKMSFATLL